MIVTTQKPLDEILDYISPYTNVLIVGCDGCTQTPRGLREAKTLSQLLELGGKLRNKDFTFKVTTMAKQCDSYLVASMLKPQMEGVEAVLSLACGIGVQTLAQLSSEIPIFPTKYPLHGSRGEGGEYFRRTVCRLWGLSPSPDRRHLSRCQMQQGITQWGLRWK